jgi:hypothetical protein
MAYNDERIFSSFEYDEMLRHDKWSRAVELASEFAEKTNKKEAIEPIKQALRIVTDKHDKYEHCVGRVRDTEKCWDDYPTKKREDAMNKAHSAFIRSEKELATTYKVFEDLIADLYGDPDWWIKSRYSDPVKVEEDSE